MLHGMYGQGEEGTGGDLLHGMYGQGKRDMPVLLSSPHHHMPTVHIHTYMSSSHALLTCPPHMPSSHALLTCPPHVPPSHALLPADHPGPQCGQLGIQPLGFLAHTWSLAGHKHIHGG